MTKIYAALYGPIPEEKDAPTRSRYGFATEEEAWKYVESQGCTSGCYQCAAQWQVVEADDEHIRLIDANEL